MSTVETADVERGDGHRTTMLFAGVGLMLAGGVALAFPLVSTFAAQTVIGVVLAVGGVIQVVQAWRCKTAAGSWTSGVLGLLLVAAGAAFALSPVFTAFSLTVLVAALLAAEGIMRTAAAVQRRKEHGAIWAGLSGVLAIVLSGTILFGLPQTAFWTLGLLVGVALIMHGAALLAKRQIAGERVGDGSAP